MTQGQMESLTIRTIPAAGAGVGTVTATTVATNNANPGVVQDYHTFSNTPKILFVDDDNGDTLETIFQSAILGADYPVIMGVTLLLAAAYVFISLLVDLTQAWVDPRIRLT